MTRTHHVATLASELEIGHVARDADGGTRSRSAPTAGTLRRTSGFSEWLGTVDPRDETIDGKPSTLIFCARVMPEDATADLARPLGLGLKGDHQDITPRRARWVHRLDGGDAVIDTLVV